MNRRGAMPSAYVFELAGETPEALRCLVTYGVVYVAGLACLTLEAALAVDEDAVDHLDELLDVELAVAVGIVHGDHRLGLPPRLLLACVLMSFLVVRHRETKRSSGK